MKPGLTIHAASRRTLYRVIGIDNDRVKYESSTGNGPWQENEMPLSVFTQGMEEVFALVSDTPQ